MGISYSYRKCNAAAIVHGMVTYKEATLQRYREQSYKQIRKGSHTQIEKTCSQIGVALHTDGKSALAEEKDDYVST